MDHWHIIGVGAIGCLWAHKLASTGAQVTLVFKSDEQLKTYQQHSTIRLTGVDGHTTSRQFVGTTLTHLRERIDKVLVCTKSWQTLSLVNGLLPHLQQASTVVLLQNGYKQLVESQPLLKEHAYYAATTTDGVYKTDAFDVVIAGNGETSMGPFNSLAIKHCLPTSTVYKPDIQQALWQKLCINAVINPLTAIYNIKNGEILNHPRCKTLIPALCEEIAVLSHAEGHTQNGEDIEKAVHNVATLTANNTSSMRQDVLLNRRTEIEEINGYWQLLGNKHSIPTPYNDEVVAAITQKQQ